MRDNKMGKLSVALATFNEAENLGRCLESIRQLAEEIIIVDGSSIDKTIEVAEKFGAKIIITDNPLIFHINKQKAIDQCSGDWILQLDADEQITPELGREIKEIIDKGSKFSAFWIKRKNYFLGYWLRKGGQYPDLVIRFFKKGKAYLPCKSVHEQMEVKGEIGWLKNDMFHYSVPTFSRYLTNSDRYTTLTAEELKERKTPLNFFTTIIYIIVVPVRIFLKIFFRHKGFLDGFPGFVFALFSALHYPVAFIKYWEMKK